MTSLVDPAIQCYPPFFLVHVLPQPWVGLIQAHFQVLKGAVDSQGGAEGGRTWGNYWEVGAIYEKIIERNEKIGQQAMLEYQGVSSPRLT